MTYLLVGIVCLAIGFASGVVYMTFFCNSNDDKVEGI